MKRSLVAALAAAIACLPGSAWAMKPTNPAAVLLNDEGVGLYRAGDYAAASDAFRRAYEIEPDRDLLFSRAQAERQLDNCALAVRLYSQYIETNPGPNGLQRANEQISACADRLVESSAGQGSGTSPPSRREGPTDEGDALEAPTESGRVRPWHRDPLGASLVGVGLGVGVTGGALLGIMSHRLQLASGTEAERRRIQGNRDYGEYEAWIDQTRGLQIGGAVATGVGAALVIAGAVRWGLLARQQKPRARETVLTPTFDGRTPGLALEIRF